MPDTIFLRDEEDRLIPLKETLYETEDFFQTLLEKEPAILAGDQIAPDDPCRWILISREFGVPDQAGGGSQWFLDHLFIDHTGVPTFVEVKRSTDTRIRREVVGQMLDYAANATEYWDVNEIRQAYEATGETLEQAFGYDQQRTEAFWQDVRNNLQLGKIRLIFAADAIPRSLLRIIEFLNNQMTDTEVLGLEVKRYRAESGRQIFVPRIVGKTIQAGTIKRKEKREWDRESFLEDVERVGGHQSRELADALMEQCKRMGCRIWYGKGSTHASAVIVYDGQTESTQLFSIYPWTKAVYTELYFQYFKAPFNTLERRRELKCRFEKDLDIAISEKRLQGRPSFPFEVFQNEQRRSAFLQTIQYMIGEIQAIDTQTALNKR